MQRLILYYLSVLSTILWVLVKYIIILLKYADNFLSTLCIHKFHILFDLKISAMKVVCLT